MSWLKKDKKWVPTESEIGVAYNPRNNILILTFIGELSKSGICVDFLDEGTFFSFKFKTKDKFLVNNIYRKVFDRDFYNIKEVRKFKLEHLENLKLK